MYKKCLAGLVWVCLCAGLFAQEAGPKFSLGGGVSAAAGFTGGGHGEFSFPLYRGDTGLDIRNHVVLRGGGGDTFGSATLSEKISLGGILPGKFRSYAFAEGGVGFYGAPSKPFFDMPLCYSFGVGGGTDIFLTEETSIYFEVGWLGQLTSDKLLHGTMIQIGWRGWF
jgi:hypothetical protein